MTMEQTLDDIQKQNEGVTLALGAVAEQLQKSNDLAEKQIRKDDDEEEQKRHEEAEEVEKSQFDAMVKSISDAVSSSLESRLATMEKQVLDLGGDKEKKVSGKSSWPMSSGGSGDDDETNTPDALDNKTENDAQKTIAAMAKQDMPPMDYDEDEMLDEEGSDEYPMEEEEMPEMPDGSEYSDTEVRNMARMIKELRKDMRSMKKKNAQLRKSSEAGIQEEVDTRLRKAGWREERGLASPKLLNKSNIGEVRLGADEVPIVKSATSGNDVVDQLAELSWADLAELRERAQHNDPNLPIELQNLGS